MLVVVQDGDWDFRHLGADYFRLVQSHARAHGYWPLRQLRTGRTGLAYVEKRHGRRVQPNWDGQAEDGRWIRSRYRNARIERDRRWADDRVIPIPWAAIESWLDEGGR